jgi:hypothetical protein
MQAILGFVGAAALICVEVVVPADGLTQEPLWPAPSLRPQAEAHREEGTLTNKGDSRRPPPPLAASARPDDAATMAASADPVIALSDGRLTVVARDTSLVWILAQISRAARIAIVANEDLGDEVVSVDMRGVPVEEGLRHILQRYDSFLYYTGGSLQALWVYPLGAGAGQEPSGWLDRVSGRELEDRLNDPDPDERKAAIRALIERRGDRARDLAVRALKDESDAVRVEALSAASEFAVTLPPEQLRDLVLKDPSEIVRYLALSGLQDDPSGAAVAKEALEDPSPHIRSYAQEILAQLAADEQSTQ